MRWRECRLRRFNKLRYFYGIRSINMCIEDKNPKILDNAELELVTAVYQVDCLANTPRMLSQYTKDA